MENTKFIVLVDCFASRNTMLPEDIQHEGVYLVEVNSRLCLQDAVAAAFDGCLSANHIYEREMFSLSAHDILNGRQHMASSDHVPLTFSHHCRNVSKISSGTYLRSVLEQSEKAFSTKH